MRSLILVTGLLLVAGTTSVASGSVRANADLLYGAASASSQQQSLPNADAGDPAVGGWSAGDNNEVVRRQEKKCPTRSLKGRYNRCK
jgi:hypothetical protein